MISYGCVQQLGGNEMAKGYTDWAEKLKDVEIQEAIVNELRSKLREYEHQFKSGHSLDQQAIGAILSTIRGRLERYYTQCINVEVESWERRLILGEILSAFYPPQYRLNDGEDSPYQIIE